MASLNLHSWLDFEVLCVMALTPFEGLLGVKFLLGLSFFVQAPGEIPHRRVYYDPPEEVRL